MAGVRRGINEQISVGWSVMLCNDPDIIKAREEKPTAASLSSPTLSSL